MRKTVNCTRFSPGGARFMFRGNGGMGAISTAAHKSDGLPSRMDRNIGEVAGFGQEIANHENEKTR